MWGEGMEALGAALLRAYQQFIYSAGLMHENGLKVVFVTALLILNHGIFQSDMPT
jgi:hypothetical protein